MFLPGDGSAGSDGGPVAVLVADPAEAAELEQRAAFAAMLDVEDLLATGTAEEPVEPWAQVGFDAWLEAVVAGDPLRPRDPAVVVADAETLPVTAGLVEEL